VRTVYFGTSEFAAVVLARLADSPHRPALVVTRPDRPKGRGRQLQAPPVAIRARELGLDVIQPERLHEDEPLAAIAAVSPEALCVCAYGVLIKEPLLSAYEMLNVHPSLLPRWRGAAPVERAIMAGDTETGVTVIKLVEELDAGPIAAVGRFPIGPEDDAGAVYDQAVPLAVELLERVLPDPTFTAQPGDGATYAEKIGPEDRALDLSRPEEAVNRVRALSPHIGARTALDGRPVTVWRARPLEHGPAPGQVADPLVVGTAEGGLRLLEIQPAGKRRMAADEYLRGLREPPQEAR
jgi:methionyl-tRNA formyltransferase